MRRSGAAATSWGVGGTIGVASLGQCAQEHRLELPSNCA